MSDAGSSLTDPPLSGDEKGGDKRTASPEAVVTPDKRQKTTKFAMRNLDEIEPKNLLVKHAELFYVTMKGEIDLIYCDQGGTEGFIHPIVSKMFQVRNDDRTGKNYQKQLKDVTRIIAIASRRMSKKHNEPEMKSGSAWNEGAKFKKSYFIRLKEYEDYVGDNKEGKLKALRALGQVMDDYNRERALKSNGHIKFNPSEIPENWNQTPDVVEAWDERLIDDDIVRIMHLVHGESKLGRKFAVENPEEAANYFTEPYPAIARSEFGYK